VLPASIGSHTQERTAFQEAGHAVVLRMVGGHIFEIGIILDHRTNIWEGGVAPVPPVGAVAQIRTAFAGPLAEALFVANLYQSHPAADWTIDRPNSIHQLLNLLVQPGPIGVVFSANGQTKTLQFDKEMFGGDWQSVIDIVQQNVLQGQLQTLLEETIDLVNRADVWAAIIRVAEELLKLRPHSTIWKIEPSANGVNRIDTLIDELVEPL